VLASWWIYSIVNNIEKLRRKDIENHLHAHFKRRTAVFANGIYFVSNAQVNPDFSFADERTVFFSGFSYAMRAVHNRVHVYHVQPGYWDQNIRQPGYHLPRLGGRPYRDAWEYLLVQRNPILRVYIESWNEYDESSGIYAADPHTIYRTEINKSSIDDRWSAQDDPFEYIRTTARAAIALKNISPWGANVLGCPQTIACQVNEKLAFWVTFRNTGATAWNDSKRTMPMLCPNSGDFRALEVRPDPLPACQDLSVYDGVFRGAVMSFRVELDAPARPGKHSLVLRLQNPRGEQFGDAIEVRLDVN
jgi:hypothetical protein